jgi:hypothetical protein
MGHKMSIAKVGPVAIEAFYSGESKMLTLLVVVGRN